MRAIKLKASKIHRRLCCWVPSIFVSAFWIVSHKHTSYRTHICSIIVIVIVIMGKKSTTKPETEKKERPKRDALPSTVAEHLKRQAGAARLSGDGRRLMMDILKASLIECGMEATYHAIANRRRTLTRRAFKNAFQTATGKTLC